MLVSILMCKVVYLLFVRVFGRELCLLEELPLSLKATLYGQVLGDMGVHGPGGPLWPSKGSRYTPILLIPLYLETRVKLV